MAADIAAACAAVSLAALGGCGSDGSEGDCGPGDAPAAGVSLVAAGETIKYGDFTSSPNNDCPPPGGGPTSLTIDSKQAEPAPTRSFHLTFCLPRPAQLGAEVVPLGDSDLDDSDLVNVVSANAELAGGCLLVQDRSAPPSGTIQFIGYCSDGLSSSGYAVELAGSVPGTKMCPDGSGGMSSESVTIQLSGSVSVQAINLP